LKLLVVSHACATPLNQQLYARVQDQTGWECTLVVPSNWLNEYGQQLRAEAWPEFGGKVIGIPVRRPGNIILHTYRASFQRLIREETPEAIYVHHEPYAAATAQVAFGRMRAGCRAPIGFYSAQNISKKYPVPFRWTESWVMRSSRFAFPVSQTVAEVLKRKGFAGEDTVVPLAIDANLYFPRPEAAVLRAELPGQVGSSFLLGYVGRLVPEKGLLTLIDAFARAGCDHARLVLIGSGPMEEQLRRAAADLGLGERVRFVGFVPHVEVPRWLSALDAMVLPSETQANWREQFGRVVLEAMACGTPVLGSDSGEIPVLINDTGGGLTFHERDADDLARQIRRLAGEPALRRSLADAGRAAVTERYTIDSAAAAFVRTVRRAVEGESPAPALAEALNP
jgi:glycosyltransferase involved in cell wall biosynthesis